MSSLKEMTTNIVKLEKFVGLISGDDKTRLCFCLVYIMLHTLFLHQDRKRRKNKTVEEKRKLNKWDNCDLICHGHILNNMVDSLFDVYQYLEPAKELCNIIEGK